MPEPKWKELGFESEDEYNSWVARQDHLDERRAERARLAAEEEAKKRKRKSIFS